MRIDFHETSWNRGRVGAAAAVGRRCASARAIRKRMLRNFSASTPAAFGGGCRRTASGVWPGCAPATLQEGHRNCPIAQEREVLRWFRHSPTEFGFPTELWTAPRVAKLIAKHFHVHFHPRYVNQWLAKRRITPQKPALRSYKRNDREVRRWLREEWPRIKKARGVGVHISS